MFCFGVIHGWETEGLGSYGRVKNGEDRRGMRAGLELEGSSND